MKRVICLFLLTASLYGQVAPAPSGPVYDSVGHMVAYVYPDGKKETYAYDSQWRMMRFRDRDEKLTTFSYGPDGSLAASRPKQSKADR